MDRRKFWYAFGMFFPIVSGLVVAFYCNDYRPSLWREKTLVFSSTLPGINIISSIILMIAVALKKIS